MIDKNLEKAMLYITQNKTHFTLFLHLTHYIFVFNAQLLRNGLGKKIKTI